MLSYLMRNTQTHIDQAFYLYKKLLYHQSDFICNGIENFLYSTIFNKNKSAYIVFYYLIDNFTRKKDKLIVENKIRINLPARFSDLDFDATVDKIQIKFENGDLIIAPLDEEKLVSLILKDVPVVSQKEELIKFDDLLNLVKNFFSKNTSFLQIALLPLVSSIDEERNSDTLNLLFQYVENSQESKVFQRWYAEGIHNISCKIFNEFVLSFTSAEYLRSTSFTDKLSDFEKLLSGEKFDLEFNVDESIPQLIHTIVLMAARYQLFCRQVESQLIRRPKELYFGLTRNVETELESALPILGLCSYKADTSEKFARIFASILDIGFIDHRFILEQQTIERLVYALETIKNFGEKYFGIDSWTIGIADAHNLEKLDSFAHVRINATKIILKLVFAKACTLWGKVHTFLSSSSISEKISPFPEIKIIDRIHIQTPIEVTYDYSKSIETIQDLDNSKLGLNHACRNDVDRYNRQVTYIRMNHLWFREKEKEFNDYTTLKPENVNELYKEYRSRKQDRDSDSIIFFSDKFLVAALNVICKDIEKQLKVIANTNTVASDALLKKVNSSIKLFRDLIEEMKKLAEFSEKFGLMKDQHLFENSFYSPVFPKDQYDPLKYERKTFDRNRDKMESEIKPSWLFMASTHYPPAYPNHYKSLCEKFDEKRKEFSASLYMELPSFLNKTTQQDIAKERNNNIQIIAIFATIVAFVTASTGSFNALKTTEEYEKFACIFVLSLLAFVAIIRLVSQIESKLLYKIIIITLCVFSLNLTSHIIVQSILCLAILCIAEYEFHYPKSNKNEKTSKNIDE